MSQPDFRALCVQALTALEYHTEQTRPIHQTNIVMDELRIALSQPAPEPPHWTEGVCGDGAAILRDGAMVPIEKVVAELNRLTALAQPAGRKEAAIAWEVCASIHREYAEGKDPWVILTTHAEDLDAMADRARAALAQPAPEPPTEEELDALWDAQDFTRRDYRVAFARAVLARYGQGNG